MSADYNARWREPHGISHHYDPTRPCAACDRAFPYPRGGCGRRKDGSYAGESKVKDETPTGTRPPSGDPLGAN